ncbi:hypothetical protein ABZ738_31400 [Micromonospora sp. NPDC047793]|uniref:hypothetical protein n=1 Tax=Micromonospora sp. NPDC047793 TaxID=3154342 RepID=UPI0033ECB01F
MRKLWFGLREAIAQAEETNAGYTAGETHEPLEPWLVLNTVGARLWFTAVNAPRPRSATIAATHDDGPPPGAESIPLYRQPLTEPDTDGKEPLDQLRAAARQGHRWLVVDTSMPPRLYTAAAYDTDRVPETAVWTPAWIATGDLGPYPGQVAHGYRHNGSVIPRLRRETVQRIAADSNARAFRHPEQDADLLVLRHHDSRIEMFVVRAPGANNLGHHNETFVVETRQLTAGPDGWFRATDGRWPWRHASPPALPPERRRGERHQHEPDVFEANGPDGIRCTVCGATGYDIAHQELPSMAGFGTDTTTSCRICGSSETYAEEIGWSSHRAVWPPALAPAPTADEEVARP